MLPGLAASEGRFHESQADSRTGVTGKLGILRRDGIFQVTLAGHPLYRFAGDAGRRGVANGQGIRSFGGIWHVVVATAAPNTPPTTTSPTSAPTPYRY